MFLFEFFLDKHARDRKIATSHFRRDCKSPMDFLNIYRCKSKICVVTDEKGVSHTFAQKRGKWSVVPEYPAAQGVTHE